MASADPTMARSYSATPGSGDTERTGCGRLSQNALPEKSHQAAHADVAAKIFSLRLEGVIGRPDVDSPQYYHSLEVGPTAAVLVSSADGTQLQ